MSSVTQPREDGRLLWPPRKDDNSQSSRWPVGDDPWRTSPEKDPWYEFQKEKKRPMHKDGTRPRQALSATVKFAEGTIIQIFDEESLDKIMAHVAQRYESAVELPGQGWRSQLVDKKKKREAAKGPLQSALEVSANGAPVKAMNRTSLRTATKIRLLHRTACL